MTELITMHTHSTFCNHAKDPLGDMVQAAVDAGIAHMAATEHYPIPDELDPSKRSTMPAERLEAYIDAVREQQKRDDIDVLLGCELDWLGKDETRALHASDFDRFDVVLGSIHFVDRWLMVSHKNMSRWKSVDLEAFWKRYVELWCEAAKSDMPFTVMAHADVVKKFSPKPEFDLEPLYERMARAAREGGRMVEVNTSARMPSAPSTIHRPRFCGRFAPRALRARWEPTRIARSTSRAISNALTITCVLPAIRSSPFLRVAVVCAWSICDVDEPPFGAASL